MSTAIRNRGVGFGSGKFRRVNFSKKRLNLSPKNAKFSKNELKKITLLTGKEAKSSQIQRC